MNRPIAILGLALALGAASATSITSVPPNNRKGGFWNDIKQRRGPKKKNRK